MSEQNKNSTLLSTENILEEDSQNGGASPLTNDWFGKNISDEVASIAAQNLKDNGFIFIKETGLYYDSNQNCYYSPDSRLYYYVDLEAYYFYDEKSQSLKFYSSSLTEDKKIKKEDDILEYQESATEEELVPEAPCLRIIVKATESAEICVGAAFVVTCYGALLGRDRQLEISLQDQLISKIHSKFHCSFFQGEYKYKIEDVGSTNGTYLDGMRIDPKSLVPLLHGNVVTVGSTQLLCHIHQMYEACKECSLPSSSSEKQASTKQATIWEKYKYELSCLKKKFGIENFIPTRFPRKYIDRAEKRRITKGSSCVYEKTDAASIDIPIRCDNKGYVLLKKMGWMEDQPIGKSVMKQ